MMRLPIVLVGEQNDAFPAHRGIPRALAMAAETLGVDVAPTWLRTDALADAPAALGGYVGIWCVPGSPYASMDGALAAVRFARESGVPFLGTCGGFQHALIEYARSVVGIANAEHAESSPDAEARMITPLACPLVNVDAAVRLAPGSRLARAYGALSTDVVFQCRFGLDEAWRAKLEGGALVFTAFDDEGNVRGLELTGHPFFVGTLFQPERAALKGALAPLVVAFLEAAKARAGV